MGLWKKNSNSNHGVTSIIDHGCEAQGRLNFIGTVAMNGKFRGELFSADTLLLGKEGEVEAEVQVGVGIISGQVKGNITGRERIELGGTARIFGNIVTPVLVLEEGAVVRATDAINLSTSDLDYRGEFLIDNPDGQFKLTGKRITFLQQQERFDRFIEVYDASPTPGSRRRCAPLRRRMSGARPCRGAHSRSTAHAISRSLKPLMQFSHR